VQYSIFKCRISDKIYHVTKSINLLNLDTWKKVRVERREVVRL